jgi:branched-chain amino acid transport system ATP-binding protein
MPGPRWQATGPGWRVFAKLREIVDRASLERAREGDGAAVSAPPREAPSGAALAVENLEVVYHDVVLVLRGVSLRVGEGEVVAVLGGNGAGKTTLLRAITGLLPVHRGEVSKGAIRLGDESIVGLDPSAIVERGVAQVMEGRRVFAELTVEENLRAGAFTERDRARLASAYERIFTLFPVLRERLGSTAGYLSGGEQQMLAIARALMASPRLLLLDEPSLGLAPGLVDRIHDAIIEINAQGTSVLLVEQNAPMALSVASRGYVLENGSVVLDRAVSELLEDRDVKEFYLGSGDGRASFRDVKSYRRRRRWNT